MEEKYPLKILAPQNRLLISDLRPLTSVVPPLSEAVLLRPSVFRNRDAVLLLPSAEGLGSEVQG